MKTPKDKLHEAVKEYLQTVFQENDPAYWHKFSAGVEAFIHTNYWETPYYPVNMYQVQESWWDRLKNFLRR